MKFFVESVVVAAVACAVGGAFGAVCDPGTYLQDDACVNCGSGFYCPGDDIRHSCPADNTDWHKALTERGYEVAAISGPAGPWSWTATGEHNVSSITQCYIGVSFRASVGSGYIEPNFTGTEYKRDSSILWYAAAAGYYLADYWFKSSSTWYHAIKPCTNAPANAYYTGPGTPDAPDGSVMDANDCPWTCDEGFGLVDDECAPLCDSGVTQLHVGDVALPLFPRSYSSPALVVGLDGRFCYGVLRPGRAGGTINIDVGGIVYHGE